ncbi:MAG: ClpXP protease specificity-enhancing factor SspB [Myxococcota bacterium]
MVHPVQSVIESLYAAGRCPRLHVNAMFEGVVCPDFIREQWRERLIIDLDPSYPLDLTFEEEWLAADLSFGGYVTRCTFPYGAVYVVADRSTGRGIVLDQNMPDSVKRSRYGKSVTGAVKPTLRSVGSAEDAPGDDPEAAPDAASDEPGNAAPAEANAKVPEPDNEDVQKRRAAFKVIDGGGG